VSTTRTVTCPACKGPSIYAPENAYRPFCSRRCKEHDFGAWANEEHRLPQAPSSDELDPDQGIELPSLSEESVVPKNRLQ